MRATYEVRAGAPADLPRALELFDAAVAWLAARAGDGRVVGFDVLGGRPAYAPAVDEPERYIEAMVTDRTRAGTGIGGALVADAIERARTTGARLVRTDCWAGSPRLIGWYEEHGFERAGSLLVGDWPGQLLARRI